MFALKKVLVYDTLLFLCTVIVSLYISYSDTTAPKKTTRFSHKFFPNNQCKSLTHFSPVFHISNPWKHKKTRGFLTFSGCRKIKHWAKMGWYYGYLDISDQLKSLTPTAYSLFYTTMIFLWVTNLVTWTSLRKILNPFNFIFSNFCHDSQMQ